MCNFTKINQQVPRLVLCFVVLCVMYYARCQLNDSLGVGSWRPLILCSLCISSLRLVLVCGGSKVVRTGDFEDKGTSDASLPESSCHL